MHIIRFGDEQPCNRLVPLKQAFEELSYLSLPVDGWDERIHSCQRIGPVSRCPSVVLAGDPTESRNQVCTCVEQRSNDAIVA